MKKEQEDALRAVVRTLKLLDGYMSTQNPDALLGWNGGMMTWAELRRHATSTCHHVVKNFQRDLTGLAAEEP